MPAKAGIQFHPGRQKHLRCCLWTPAFAGVTTSWLGSCHFPSHARSSSGATQGAATGWIRRRRFRAVLQHIRAPSRRFPNVFRRPAGGWRREKRAETRQFHPRIEAFQRLALRFPSRAPLLPSVSPAVQTRKRKRRREVRERLHPRIIAEMTEKQKIIRDSFFRSALFRVDGTTEIAPLLPFKFARMKGWIAQEAEVPGPLSERSKKISLQTLLLVQNSKNPPHRIQAENRGVLRDR